LRVVQPFTLRQLRLPTAGGPWTPLAVASSHWLALLLFGPLLNAPDASFPAWRSAFGLALLITGLLSGAALFGAGRPLHEQPVSRRPQPRAAGRGAGRSCATRPPRVGQATQTSTPGLGTPEPLGTGTGPGRARLGGLGLVGLPHLPTGARDRPDALSRNAAGIPPRLDDRASGGPAGS